MASTCPRNQRSEKVVVPIRTWPALGQPTESVCSYRTDVASYSATRWMPRPARLARNRRARPPTKCNDLRPRYTEVPHVASRCGRCNYVKVSDIGRRRKAHPKSSASANSATLAVTVGRCDAQDRRSSGCAARAGRHQTESSARFRPADRRASPPVSHPIDTRRSDRCGGDSLRR